LEYEGKVLASLLGDGGHVNIIHVLDHGWLRSSAIVYYIDMERAEMSLADYICYHGDKQPSIFWAGVIPPENQSFVHKGCQLLQRLRNMWTVGVHIAGGLEFMHLKGHVHRDMKPSNGPFAIVHSNSKSYTVGRIVTGR
jgi:serine/threonine protein kinase